MAGTHGLHFFFNDHQGNFGLQESPRQFMPFASRSQVGMVTLDIAGNQNKVGLWQETSENGMVLPGRCIQVSGTEAILCLRRPGGMRQFAIATLER